MGGCTSYVKPVDCACPLPCRACAREYPGSCFTTAELECSAELECMSLDRVSSAGPGVLQCKGKTVYNPAPPADQAHLLRVLTPEQFTEAVTFINNAVIRSMERMRKKLEGDGVAVAREVLSIRERHCTTAAQAACRALNERDTRVRFEIDVDGSWIRSQVPGNCTVARMSTDAEAVAMDERPDRKTKSSDADSMRGQMKLLLVYLEPANAELSLKAESSFELLTAAAS